MVNSPSFFVKVHLSAIREIGVGFDSVRVSDSPRLSLQPCNLHQRLVSLLEEPHESLSLRLTHSFLNDGAPE